MIGSSKRLLTSGSLHNVVLLRLGVHKGFGADRSKQYPKNKKELGGKKKGVTGGGKGNWKMPEARR